MIATPQTIATCHSPAWALVSTAVWTAPQPKNTRRKVPSTSARQRALNDGVGCPMQEDLCGERPFRAGKRYSNLGENDGKAANDTSPLSNRRIGLRLQKDLRSAIALPDILSTPDGGAVAFPALTAPHAPDPPMEETGFLQALLDDSADETSRL